MPHKYPVYPDQYRSTRRFLFPKSFLYKLHVLQRLNPVEIAAIHKKKLGVSISPQAVRGYLKKYKLYNTAHPEPVKILSGEKWKYLPKHKLSNKYGRVRLKIPVMEKKYGIAFNSKKHIIRFLDGDSLNCNPKNIKLIYKNWERSRAQDVVYGTCYLEKKIRENRNYKTYLNSLSETFRSRVLRRLFINLVKKKTRRRLNEREKKSARFIIKNYVVSWELAKKIELAKLLIINWPKIEEMRKSACLTRSEFCRKAGLDRVAYHLVQKKGITINGLRSTVLKISRFLKIHPSTISKEIIE